MWYSSISAVLGELDICQSYGHPGAHRHVCLIDDYKKAGEVTWYFPSWSHWRMRSGKADKRKRERERNLSERGDEGQEGQHTETLRDRSLQEGGGRLVRNLEMTGQLVGHDHTCGHEAGLGEAGGKFTLLHLVPAKFHHHPLWVDGAFARA